MGEKMGQPKRSRNSEEQVNQSYLQKQNKSFSQDITSQNVSSGLISFTLIMTGPALIIL
jgi:benzoate membrane transport protein